MDWMKDRQVDRYPVEATIIAALAGRLGTKNVTQVYNSMNNNHSEG